MIASGLALIFVLVFCVDEEAVFSFFSSCACSPFPISSPFIFPLLPASPFVHMKNIPCSGYFNHLCITQLKLFGDEFSFVYLSQANFICHDIIKELLCYKI